MNEVGAFALDLALVVVAYTTLAAFLGMGRRRPELTASAENGVFVALGLLTVASAAIV